MATLISTSGDMYTTGYIPIFASGDMYVAGCFLASGFLNSENVVFYHPLDNYVDGVQGDTWLGSAAFFPAIISSGIGSARLGGPLISQGTSIAQSRYLYGSWLSPIVDDDDRALLLYNYGDDYVKANVLTTVDDEVVLEGTDKLYPVSGNILVGIGKNHAIHVSGNFYAASVAITVPGGDYAIMLATATVDGATVEWNTPIGFGRNGQNVGTYHSLSTIPDAPSGSFLLVHSVTGPLADNESIRIHHCYIDDGGNPYVGSPTIITSGDYAQVRVLDSNKAVITYRDLISNQNSVRIINISGTTLSLENPTSYISDDFSNLNSLSRIDSSGFLTGNVSPDDGSTIYFIAHKVFGYTIEAISSGVVSGIPSNFSTSVRTTYDSQQSRGLYQFVNYGGSVEAVSCGYFTIDNDYNLDLGNRTDYSFTQNLEPLSETPITWLGNDRFLSFLKIFVGQTKIAYVIYDKANEIYSQIPSAYPSATGASGLTLGSWTNMSSISGTLFRTGRDCNIHIASNYISLGSGTAYWNDSGIIDLITSIDDDIPHFLIVDFRYQGGDNWKLYTSLDGQNWVDQGIQNSGSQGPIETTIAPHIGFADEDMDQLLDEVILWKDTDQFDALELMRLHALGTIYNKPMNEYQDNLVVLPYNTSCNLYTVHCPEIVSSMTLFIYAPPPDVYNTKSLYINGPELCAISGNLFSFGAYVASKSGSLFVLGPQQTTISKDLFISGPRQTTISGDLFISGPQLMVDSGNLFIYGHEDITTSSDLFIQGYELKNNYISLYIDGIRVTSKIYACGDNTNRSLGVAAEVNRVTSLQRAFGNLFIKYPYTKYPVCWTEEVPVAHRCPTTAACTPTQGVCVDEDGHVWSVGTNTDYALGIGITNESFVTSIPIRVSGLPDIPFVGTRIGDKTSFAIAENGTVWAWGHNSHGELGIGNTQNQHTAQQVLGIMNTIDIDVSAHHSVFITTSGVFTCGDYTDGRLGISGVTENVLIPQQVSGLNGTDIIDVACGNDTTMFLTASGDIYFCGKNNHGLFGDGTAKNTIWDVPTLSVSGTSYSCPTDITCDTNSSAFLCGSGDIHCAGYNRNGKFGNGVTVGDYIDFIKIEQNIPSGVNIRMGDEASWLSCRDFASGVWAAGGSIDGEVGTTEGIPWTSWQQVPNSANYLRMWGTEKQLVVYEAVIERILHTSKTTYLYISGPLLSSTSGDLFIYGYDNIHASGDLFTQGHETISVSEDLYINGHELLATSGNLFLQATGLSGVLARPIDWLLKTSDHYPQILGTLDGATSVNIQLWEITDGQNAPTSISSSGCYQIGDTGRWAWSTSGLPVYTTRQRQYFYLMTANNSETFTGQFFLELPERAKWIHPGDQSEYLIQV